LDAIAVVFLVEQWDGIIRAIIVPVQVTAEIVYVPDTGTLVVSAPPVIVLLPYNARKAKVSCPFTKIHVESDIEERIPPLVNGYHETLQTNVTSTNSLSIVINVCENTCGIIWVFYVVLGHSLGGMVIVHGRRIRRNVASVRRAVLGYSEVSGAESRSRHMLFEMCKRLGTLERVALGRY
jgi:hypothetical protein